ncbi:hypothetical protein ACWDRR_01965 [Kitasatospora sp. NPDC003701]
MSAPGTGPLDSVDQIAFRWQGNQGRRGSGTAAAAWSCARERAEDLAHELAPMLRVDDALRPSVVRTVLQDGEAALVQRWPTADAGGRPNTAAHVLLGPAKILGPRTCLGLRDWSWSRPEFAEEETGRCDPVPISVLWDAAEPAWADTLAQLPDVREALTAATAALLRRPAHRLSVRSDALPGWPRENRSGVVIAGLYQIFGIRWPRRSWTFATYDMTDRHDVMITWVADWSTDSEQQRSRYRIDPRRPEADLAHELAARLVERCLVAVEDGPRTAGLPELAGGLANGAAMPAEARLRELAAVLGVRPGRPGGGSAPAVRPVERPVQSGPDRSGNRRTGGADGWTDGRRYEGPDERSVDRLHEGPDDRPHDRPHERAVDRAENRGDDRGGDRTGGAHSGGGRYQEPDDPDQAPVYETPAPVTTPPPSPDLLRADLLRIVPHLSDAVREDLQQRIAALSEPAVLDLLREEALPFRAVNQLLEGLWRREGRSAEQESELCAEVLRQRLYLYRAGPDQVGHAGADDSRLAERAAWLFGWAVAPHTRDPRHTKALGAWLGELVRHDTGLEAQLLRRLVPPPGEQADPGMPPDLPPELWRQLLHEFSPGAPGTAGPPGAAAVQSRTAAPRALPAFPAERPTEPSPPSAGTAPAGAPGQPGQPVERRPPPVAQTLMAAQPRAAESAVPPGPAAPAHPPLATAEPPERPRGPLYSQPHHRQGEPRDDLRQIAMVAAGLLTLLAITLAILFSRH